MPGRMRIWLPRVFWIAAGCSALLLIVPAVDGWLHPHGEFAGLAVFGLGVMALLVGLICAVVAFIRKPLAYAIGLVLVAYPLVWWGMTALGNATASLQAPSAAEEASGRGYFTAPGDKALAEAIVAGDAGRVAALAPAANLAAEGWDGMSFMRLALERANADPAIVGALLRAGIDPNQDGGVLFVRIYKEKNMALLQQVVDAGVDLNRHMDGGRWYLFVRGDWPEGLAVMLDHGANTEVTDAMGYTEIMRSARGGSWALVELLLAHGARTDHVGNDGQTLRDALKLGMAETRDPVPPEIQALAARLQ